MPIRASRGRRAALTALAVLAACTTGEHRARLAGISIHPAPGVIGIGTTLRLPAVGIRSSGDREEMASQFIWFSSNTKVAAIAPYSGVVTAVGVGRATIRAEYPRDFGRFGRLLEPVMGWFYDSVSVTVTDAPLQSIQVVPSDSTVTQGARIVLTAVGTFADGATQDLSAQAAWNTSHPDVASVVGLGRSGGTVVARQPGRALIVARFAGVTGGLPLVVRPPAPAAGPLRVAAGNSRYFATPAGEITFLVGAHHWKNGQDSGPTDPPPEFDFGGYLDSLQAHNMNFFRYWMWEQSKGAVKSAEATWFAPTPYARTGPGDALDGKPKFDVSRFNEAYFDRLRQRVIEAGRRGIYVSVMLFDGWSLESKGPLQVDNPWPGHPYNRANNINGVDGDLNGDGSGGEVHTLANPHITALQEAYVRRVVDAVNDQDNVLYEISNESEPDARAWEYHVIEFVKQYEATKPKQHPVGMTAFHGDGKNEDLFASPADWVSPTGLLESPEVADGSKVVVGDTDHICGICGSVGWGWKTFTRGQNILMMDGYDGGPGWRDPLYDPDNPLWEAMRRTLGDIGRLAGRLDLRTMTPHGELASSGYCLADLASAHPAVVVFTSNGDSVTVDLSGTSAGFVADWLDPYTGRQLPGGTVTGGGRRAFAPPTPQGGVLYLHAGDSRSP